ncbi:unnamed protein product [Hydatigera taeniaeformis]|uniref:WAP domain-containing protein n=1 Tax=Hydatigena taeniaeformis TaxID=6205 RepID=A0A0R3X8E1_HYDTA|nr:unnamed protein product [Hydatigera taeniaeformis]
MSVMGPQGHDGAESDTSTCTWPRMCRGDLRRPCGRAKGCRAGCLLRASVSPLDI